MNICMSLKLQFSLPHIQQNERLIKPMLCEIFDKEPVNLSSASKVSCMKGLQATTKYYHKANNPTKD